jgi:hypothetical protein
LRIKRARAGDTLTEQSTSATAEELCCIRFSARPDVDVIEIEPFEMPNSFISG